MSRRDGHDDADPARHRLVLLPTRTARRFSPWILLILAVAVVGVWTLRRSNMDGSTQIVDVEETRRRALALYGGGRFDEAVKAYESTLAVEEDAGTRINLGNALKKLGRVDEAESQYRRALALDPRNATAWYDLGNLMRDQRHDVRGAVEALRRATEIDPNMAVAHFSLGVASIDLADYEGAIASLQTALQLAPENVSWRNDAQNALTLAHVRDAEQKGLLQPPGHK